LKFIFKVFFFVEKKTTSCAGGRKSLSYGNKNLRLLECRGFADRYKNKRRIQNGLQ